MSRSSFATALPGLLLAAVLAGCGGQTGAGASSPVVAPTPEPIPVVEPSCIADYVQYAADPADLVGSSDAIVRGRATASRDHELRPGVSTGTDPAVNPQRGVPQEEIDTVPGIPSTALSVTVTEVIEGDLTPGQTIEVNQNTCTSRPLPVGEDTDYVLALSGEDDGTPFAQLNDSQAAWQVSDDLHREPEPGAAAAGDLSQASPSGPCSWRAHREQLGGGR